MKTKLTIFILIILITIGSGIYLLQQKTSENDFEKNQERVLSPLYLAIEEAEKMGKYKCRIEPSCTMCYLGNWVWEDGTCDCGGEIAMGEWDKVCPQCIRGIKEGRCKLLEISACPVL